jgi:hypothetical protein
MEACISPTACQSPLKSVHAHFVFMTACTMMQIYVLQELAACTQHWLCAMLLPLEACMLRVQVTPCRRGPRGAAAARGALAAREREQRRLSSAQLVRSPILWFFVGISAFITELVTMDVVMRCLRVGSRGFDWNSRRRCGAGSGRARLLARHGLCCCLVVEVSCSAAVGSAAGIEVRSWPLAVRICAQPRVVPPRQRRDDAVQAHRPHGCDRVRVHLAACRVMLAAPACTALGLLKCQAFTIAARSELVAFGWYTA